MNQIGTKAERRASRACRTGDRVAEKEAQTEHHETDRDDDDGVHLCFSLGEPGFEAVVQEKNSTRPPLS